MAETAEADVSAARRAAGQQEGSAMATVERRLPSPEALLGQPWTHWIDAAKHQGADGEPKAPFNPEKDFLLRVPSGAGNVSAPTWRRQPGQV